MVDSWRTAWISERVTAVDSPGGFGRESLARCAPIVTSRDSADQTPLPGDDDARRFRSAFDNASIGMALVAADGRWLDVNRSFCELLGYDAAQLLELTEQQLTHPDDHDAGCAQVARA